MNPSSLPGLAGLAGEPIARRSLDAAQCALVVIDIQEKLLPAVLEREELVRNARLLIRLAGILEIPVLVTTQYARGLGATVSEIAELLPGEQAIDKLDLRLLCRRGLLRRSARCAGSEDDPAAMWNGEPHLRDADGAGSARERLHGARGL